MVNQTMRCAVVVIMAIFQLADHAVIKTESDYEWVRGCVTPTFKANL